MNENEEKELMSDVKGLVELYESEQCSCGPDVGLVCERCFTIRTLQKLEVLVKEKEEKLLKICIGLVELDEEQKCMFCKKDEWGSNLHEENCPFKMAYDNTGRGEVR